MSKVINYIDLINKIELKYMCGKTTYFDSMTEKDFKKYSKLMEWWDNEK